MSALSPDANLVRDRIDVRRFPWIRPLVGAFAHDFARLRPFYAGDPADRGAWTETIARVQRAPRDRAALGRVLDAQLASRGAPDQSRQAAGRLASAGSVAVVTGQQAGAFGGPLYTLLKAVTALQLAERTGRDHGVPAAAVFWVECEDHDWNEIRTAAALDADFALRRVTLADPPGAGSQPVAALALDDRVQQALAELQTILPSTEFTADLMTSLARCYRAGVSPSRAFAGWLDGLLGRYGLIVFEANDPAAKPLAAELFARELETPHTAELAAEAGAAMAAIGHAPQVDPTSDGIGLFYLDQTGRHPIKRRGDAYAIGDRVRPVRELVAEASAHPERFSPGVLLRPLVQDRIFPTICYVGGPSELAYLGQLAGAYRHLAVEPPLVYPRANATVLDSAALRFLERSELPLEALAPQDESALNALLQRQMPPAVDAALAELDRDLRRQVEGLKQAVASIDPTLSGAVDTTADRVRETVKTLHNKIVQAAKRKDDTLRRQFTRTQALAFPGGVPQERALSLPFFLNRYGPALCDALIAGLPHDIGYHYIVSL